MTRPNTRRRGERVDQALIARANEFRGEDGLLPEELHRAVSNYLAHILWGKPKAHEYADSAWCTKCDQTRARIETAINNLQEDAEDAAERAADRENS